MPLYQGDGPFPITVRGREFEFSFEDGPCRGLIVEASDGSFSVRMGEDHVLVSGPAFPGTTAKRPQLVELRPTVIRSPHERATNVIESCLLELDIQNRSTDGSHPPADTQTKGSSNEPATDAAADA